MKKLVFGTLMAFAASGAGCIISSDDSNPVCGDGIQDSNESCDHGANNGAAGDSCSSTCTLVVSAHTTTATWAIKNVSGAATSCPTGFDTAILVSWKVDGTGNPIGNCLPGQTPTDTCFLDLFSCAAGTGTSGPLPAGQFLTFVAITSHDGSSVYAESHIKPGAAPDSDILDLTTSNRTYDTTIFNDGGYFQVGWNLVGANSGNTLSCSQAGAAGISTLSTVTGGSASVDDIFKCSDTVGLTGELLAGSYTVSVTAINTDAAGGLALGAPTNLAAQTILDQNQVTNLGTLMLSIDGM